MNGNDILKELEIKNKEIYLNTLNANLASNLENILQSLDDKFKIQSLCLQSKISEIISSNTVQSEVDRFINNLLTKLKALLINRSNILKEYISNIDNQEYAKLLSDEKESLFNEFSVYYNGLSLPLIEVLSGNVDKFTKMRLAYYISNIFFDKLILSIKDTVSTMDRILCNNYQFDYDRFQKINENTIKKV